MRTPLPFVLLLACTLDEPAEPRVTDEDPGADDSGPDDSGADDSGTDTGSDSATTDTGDPDTGADTGGGTDTATADTATSDTGGDTGPADIDVSTADATIQALEGLMDLSGTGDLDGDGLDDVAITTSAPDPDLYDMAYVFTAPRGTLEVTDAFAARRSDSVRTLDAVSVRAVGDLTGGGTATLALGSLHESGSVLLWEGPLRGDTAGGSTATAAIVFSEGSESLRIPGDFLGPGDIDGDGADDLVVSVYDGTTYDDHPETTWVLRGPLSGVRDVRDADTTIRASRDHHAGQASSLAALGDTDGDGLADFALCDTLDQRAYVYADLPLGDVERVDDATGSVEIDVNARSVEGLGDVDGDGYADLAVGAWPFEGGNVAVYRGPFTREVTAAEVWATWRADRAHLDFGSSIAGIGDTDGDGRADLLLGSSDGAYLAVGLAGGTWTPADATVRFTSTSRLTVGTGVAAAGDTDGDGLADLLIGGRDLSGNRGEVWLFSGRAW